MIFGRIKQLQSKANINSQVKGLSSYTLENKQAQLNTAFKEIALAEKFETNPYACEYEVVIKYAQNLINVKRN